MTTRKPFVVVAAVSTTVTSAWFVTDARFDENPERVYAGIQTTGGTTKIQVAVSVEANPTWLYTIATITSTTFDGTIHGAWPQIRFIQQNGAPGDSAVLIG